MPEYECYPIWISNNDGIFENTDPQELQISESLKSQILNWDSKFKNTYNRENPIESGFKGENEIQLFEREGILIWANIVRELKESIVKYRSIKTQKEYTSPFDYILDLS